MATRAVDTDNAVRAEDAPHNPLVALVLPSRASGSTTSPATWCGADGFVSIEVSPRLAHDHRGTLDEARRLWQEVGRPNVMIKVPGTSGAAPTIGVLLHEGIHVNVTLLGLP